jgi:TolB-like protein/Tfp pilus assembly protein PilF
VNDRPPDEILRNLWERAQRRKVVQWGLGYAAAAWGLLQVLQFFAETFDWPGRWLQLGTLVLIPGLPIALVIAWFHGDRGSQRVSAAEAALLVCLLAGGAALVWRYDVLNRAPSETSASTVVARGTDEDRRPSIAVLPFADLTADRDQGYFADGLAEEILSILARSPGIRIVGRTSSFQFKGRDLDLREIGSSLGVANILEGSVRRSGDRVRVNARLVRAANGSQLWSESYDRQLTDVFAMQEDIASEIARRLAVPLDMEPGLQARDRTADPVAYDHYLHGLALFSQRADVAQAGWHFEQAVALDPRFAAAWAALADVYIAVPSWLDEYQGEKPTVAVFQRRAERAALRALELNPRIAATHHALSVVYRDRWQWAQAEDAIRRAVELAPNTPVFLEDYQEFLENIGRWELSAQAIERAVELEPLNPFYHAISGIALWHLRDYEHAIESMRRALGLDPGLTDFHVEYVGLLLDAGRVADAAAYVEGCDACEPKQREFMRSAIRHIRRPEGRFEYGDTLRYTFGDYVFRYLIGGESSVLDALERAAAAGELVPLSINSQAIAATRHSPRYRALVTKVGLEDYWRARGWPQFCQPVGAVQFDCR